MHCIICLWSLTCVGWPSSSCWFPRSPYICSPALTWLSLTPNTPLSSSSMTDISRALHVCVSAAADWGNQCFLSRLCSLFAELNGRPVTKKHRCTGKNEMLPLKVNYFVGGMQAYRFCSLLFREPHKGVGLNAKLLSDCVFFLTKSSNKSRLTVFTSN